MIELKKCPFCGGAASIQRESHTSTRKITIPFHGDFTTADPKINDGWLAECIDCGARGPHEYTEPVQSIEDAAKLWNTRTEDTK